MSTSLPDLDALKKLAAAATPGPWSREKPATDMDGWPRGVVVAMAAGRQPVYAEAPNGSFPSADCSFIAAANPQAILALIASHKAKDAEIRTLRNAAVSLLDERDENRRLYVEASELAARNHADAQQHWERAEAKDARIAKLEKALRDARADALEDGAQKCRTLWRSTPNERTDDAHTSFRQNAIGPGCSACIDTLLNEAAAARAALKDSP